MDYGYNGSYICKQVDCNACAFMLDMCDTLSVTCIINGDVFIVFSKWRTTPVVEEVFAEVSALAAGVAVVVAAEAVEEAAVPGEANLRIKR